MVTVRFRSVLEVGEGWKWNGGRGGGGEGGECGGEAVMAGVRPRSVMDVG